jgi:hypothetical protein
MAHIDLDALRMDINDLVHSELIAKLNEGSAREGLGINPLSVVPAQYWYNEDMLVVHTSHANRLDYYGGFEYVKGEDREIIGNYTAYRGENKRVRAVLDRLNNVERDEDDESDEE